MKEELLLLTIYTPNQTSTISIQNGQIAWPNNVEYLIQQIVSVYSEKKDEIQQRNGTSSISAYSRADMKEYS